MAKKLTNLPVFGIIVTLLGIYWLLNELGVIKVAIPWWPVIVILVGLKMILMEKHYK
jgi:apolipoprotein N-acyltransferase